MADQDTTSLIPKRLFSAKRFREDAKCFLSMSPKVLSAISRLANDSEGFDPSQKASALSEQTGLSIEEARQVLTSIRYFYDRISEHRIPLPDAIKALKELAASLSLTLTDDHWRAITDVLSYKKEYERGKYARLLGVKVGPHFLGLEGDWSLKIFRTREDESIKVAVLMLSLLWHDGQGEGHEAFLQLNDTDWHELTERIAELVKERESLSTHLE